MINPLINFYRRLNLLQRQRGIKITLTILFVLTLGVIFGSLIYSSYQLEAQRSKIEQALTGQNLASNDHHAISLSETGTVTVDGKTYGDERIRQRAELFFDENGNIIAPSVIADVLTYQERPSYAPKWLLDQPGTTWLLGIAAILFSLLVIWANLLVPYVFTVIFTAFAAVVGYAIGGTQLALAIAVMGNLIFAFIMLTHVSLAFFHSPRQLFAVAHTVIKEASRTRISLVFIILLLILLPLLPIWLDPEAPLRFRIQTFISRSFGLTFAITACMTLFLSCATVAFEIRDRQIWQLMTKPLSRFNYLVGKWLGVMTINLIVLIIAGLSTFAFIQYLRMQPVASGTEGQVDAMILRDQILTARLSTFPEYPSMQGEELQRRVEQTITNDPILSQQESVPREAWRRVARSIQQQFSSSLRSIPALVGDQAGARSYTFKGLEQAKDVNSTLTLQYRFHILADDEHKRFPAAFFFNEDTATWIDRVYVPTMLHVLPITPDLIQDDGTLTLTIVNLSARQPEMGSLNFDADGLELRYKVGGFEANFVRAVLMSWIKLAFLAALGIFLSTFLSFPVACLFAFTVFIAGSLGPYLASSLEYYYPPETQYIDWGNLGHIIQWAFQWTIRVIAQALVFLLEGFGEYRPTQNLIEGIAIRWRDIVGGFAKLGLFWSGASLVLGLIVIRSRQLAIYSGHG